MIEELLTAREINDNQIPPIISPISDPLYHSIHQYCFALFG